jgi:hypothetical protein
MMEVRANGFAEHQRGYFISSGSASGVMNGWRVFMRIPNDGVPWTRRVFRRNSVHGSRMRIFCGFCAKEQEFVLIRLEERFPNAFKTVKIRMHKSKKLSQDEYKR